MREPKKPCYYLLFYTIHDLLKAEKRLKERGFTIELLPIPRNLSTDCGSCICLHDDIEGAGQSLADIKMERRFFFNGTEFEPLE